MLRILSLGAGVQSTAVLLMSCRGILPKLDAAVFADTQWEPKAVYSHLDWLEEEANKCGVPIYRVTRGDLRAEALSALTQRGGLGQDRLAADFKRWAAMPLYTLDRAGGKGMVQRQCTKEYKIEVVEKFIRRELLGLRPRQVAPANAVQHWFGISADEVYRMRDSPNHWQVNHYPLITEVLSPKKDTLFGRGYSRQDCLDWMEAEGYPRPPRSACIGCPFHSDEEWARMKETDPESWADAVEFDRAIRSTVSPKNAGRLVGMPFLHASRVPLGMVAFKAKDVDGGWGNECQGVCGV